MSETNLLLCPFCGIKLQCKGGDFYFHGKADCILSEFEFDGLSEKDWNTRTPPNPVKSTDALMTLSYNLVAKILESQHAPVMTNGELAEYVFSQIRDFIKQPDISGKKKERDICPQCDEFTITANLGDGKVDCYCEECGWPDENRSAKHNEGCKCLECQKLYPASNDEVEKKCFQSLQCLYLATDGEIAKDVNNNVKAHLSQLTNQIERMRGALEDIYSSSMIHSSPYIPRESRNHIEEVCKKALKSLPPAQFVLIERSELETEQCQCRGGEYLTIKCLRCNLLERK